jgi:hypothetical protein
MPHRPQPSDAPSAGQPPPRQAEARLPAEWRNAARFLRQKLRGSGGATRRGALPIPRYAERATCASFQMDGVSLGADEFRAALARGSAARSCRTRSAQRARNHVAILHRVEILLRRGQPLQTGDVIRWYTSIACGLSAGGLTDQGLARIEGVVSAVNSPRLRFWPAVKEVATLHVKLLDDPFVPGFNGILARLLLRYHMGRGGLPPVVFDPATDPPRLRAVSTLEPRLLELILATRDVDFTP